MVPLVGPSWLIRTIKAGIGKPGSGQRRVCGSWGNEPILKGREKIVYLYFVYFSKISLFISFFFFGGGELFFITNVI